MALLICIYLHGVLLSVVVKKGKFRKQLIEANTLMPLFGLQGNILLAPGIRP